MKSILFPVLACAFTLALWVPGTNAGEAVESEGGKYFDAEGEPTYFIAEDGTVDWFTYSGFRRYHSECHVCHGPDGLGSSFGPALSESLQNLSYDDYMEVVVNGRENVGSAQQNKMPGFGLNQNVMCYVDDIYVYLKARSDEAVGRGRPKKKEAKSDETREAEDACMEG